eukprot:CAMPEP_0202016004 /NCGR_PEP_ID=MMETSP0905-20130828/33427_1 /ASSEMBLY_ACC=CAM_ASM_000554 /TAXON_ID=420261 /ORGANISM="Thalassiosira antarctica, Strain CCMP982" /LENGTH=39 /DNA_ID= /DNA_START= /DNA_END= /DNA_ORIENTATION=
MDIIEGSTPSGGIGVFHGLKLVVLPVIGIVNDCSLGGDR